MPTSSIQTLIKRLRSLRQKHGLTQEAFAEVASMSYKYYQSVETGKQNDLRLSTLDRIAKTYHVEGWQLLAPTLPRTKIVQKSKIKAPHYSKTKRS